MRRIDKITPFKSGTKLSALCVYFIYIADLIGLEFQPCGQKCFNVKSVLVICVGSIPEIGVLGDVVLIRKERPHTTQLEVVISTGTSRSSRALAIHPAKKDFPVPTSPNSKSPVLFLYAYFQFST